jgi:hypothetical protein
LPKTYELFFTPAVIAEFFDFEGGKILHPSGPQLHYAGRAEELRTAHSSEIHGQADAEDTVTVKHPLALAKRYQWLPTRPNNVTEQLIDVGNGMVLRGIFDSRVSFRALSESDKHAEAGWERGRVEFG